MRDPAHSEPAPVDAQQLAADEQWMQLALAEADAAEAHADVPIGCVIVGPDSKLLAAGHNRREVDADPTAHAEVVAIRTAAHRRGHWRLDGCTLYVTLEPCPMCAGAIINSRISRVVYGAADAKAGALDSLYSLGKDQRLNHRFEHRAMVLADESVARLRGFFAKLRAEGQK
ncbi:MAG: nucleoside deaminase [Polyangiaceae bacterium]